MFKSIKASVKAITKFGAAVAAFATAHVGKVVSALGGINLVNKIFRFGDKLAAFAVC